MRRRLFAAVSAISLLMCVGTVVMWVRGKFFLEDQCNLLCRSDAGGGYVVREFELRSGFGRVAIDWTLARSAERSLGRLYFSVDEGNIGRVGPRISIWRRRRSSCWTKRVA